MANPRRLLFVSAVDCCSICKKQKPCPWQCEVCARAGLVVTICSPVCRGRHGRDGRHRKELKLARGAPK